MMKNEDTSRTTVLLRSELPLPSFAAHAPAGNPSDEIVKLGTENVRLQRLVAELLIENQQLRQRYCGSRGDTESVRLSTAPVGDRWGN